MKPHSRPRMLLAFALLFALSTCVAGQKEPLAILFLGDIASIEKYMFVSRVYSQRLAEALAKKGISTRMVRSGKYRTAEGIKRRFDSCVLNYMPDLVIMQFGLRDSTVKPSGRKAGPLGPIDVFERNLAWLLKRIKAAGGQVILMTPNPRKEDEQLTGKYAESVRRIAADHAVPLVDAYKWFRYHARTEGKSWKALYCNGYKVKEKGHALIADWLFEAIASMIESSGLAPKKYAPPALPDCKPILLLNEGRPGAVRYGGIPWNRGKPWNQKYLQESGKDNTLLSGLGITGGDFRIRARLRMDRQRESFAAFSFDGNYILFEDFYGHLCLVGPAFGGFKRLAPSPAVIPRGAWLDFEAVLTGSILRLRINDWTVHAGRYSRPAVDRIEFHPVRSNMQIRTFTLEGNTRKLPAPMPAGYTLPRLDLARETDRQVVVDRKSGQRLLHPTTVLLEDGKTILAVYHAGRGRILMKQSEDGGLTWSDRLPVPKSWATIMDIPTIHRVVDRHGKQRLILFAGLHPVRSAVSEDGGRSWSELRPVGDWGGLVAMASVARLKNGDHAAFFHDDGRFIRDTGQGRRYLHDVSLMLRNWTGMHVGLFTVYMSLSRDGGLTWSRPEIIAHHPAAHLCEPGFLRSPDGNQIALLLREDSRRYNSCVIFSNDEGKTWTEPRELPAALTGDRHRGRYAPDGRLLITLRDTTRDSRTRGDWVAWVGTYEDIVKGREGQYRVRLMDNKHRWNCGYAGLELLEDGTFVATSYGTWKKKKDPFIVSVRLKLAELDAMRE